MEAKVQNPKAIGSVIRFILDNPAFRGAAESLRREGMAEIAISGLTRSAKALLVAGLASNLGTASPSGEQAARDEGGKRARPIVAITADNEAADTLAENTSTFLQWLQGADAASRVGVLPSFDCSPYEDRSPHPEVAERRAVALWNLARGLTDVLFVPVSAALGRFRSRAFYRSLALELKPGDELSLDDLVDHLGSVGYEPGEPVYEVGQYSLRGGILDVFPPQSNNPLRIEFFGDQIESLRDFDPSSQRSQNSVASALLLPLAESTRSPKFFSTLTEVLAQRASRSHKNTGRRASLDEQTDASLNDRQRSEEAESRDPALSPEPPSGTLALTAAQTRVPDWAAEYSGAFPGWEFFVPLVEPHPNTLFSLITETVGHQSRSAAGSQHSLSPPPASPQRKRRESTESRGGQAETGPNELRVVAAGPLVIWDEKLERTRELKELVESWAAGFDELRDVIPSRPQPEDVALTEAEFFKALELSGQINLKELSVATGQVAAEESDSASVFLSVLSGPSSPHNRDLSPSSGGASTVVDSSPNELAASVDPDSATDEGTPSANVPGAPAKGKRPVPMDKDEVTEDARESRKDELIFPTQAAPKFHGAIKGFIEDLRTRLARGETAVFVMPTPGKADRLREILSEYEIPFANTIDDPADSKHVAVHGAQPQSSSSRFQVEPEASGLPNPEASNAVALIARGRLNEGVEFLELRLLLLSDADLFGKFDWGGTGRRERSAASSFISDLSDLKVGDYVVHVDHGIGQYQGLRQLGVGGAQRDFMLITYQEEARLYVPLERLDLVEKYRSAEGGKPVLDRLGGVTWARTKARVKRALRDMAQELLQLYAERKMKGGTAYSRDTPWQKEFEGAFEFEETPDQLRALEDIKGDLESSQPMDRLLCGDVGYGKTELAMRAAFKVVQDGKQVAVLAPTTVLAFQHLNTFRKRMSAFPMRVEMVSRFRTAAEQKKVLQETEAGNVDILIGTHRLFSKDVSFRDLGLLVVDEEQRFGVAAKERLKKMKVGVEVLTMSATPIPRTLNMSLGGLRDLSLIETPPRGRLAIQTVVAPFGPGIIQSAILQEMGREGQVYFVHNRVESIFTVAEMIQKLVPTARLGVAHGQMGEKELERVMLKFIQGEYHVLVSTVLIENGLDIPRANTLIVNHAERFGLADLYQLRGRVGRSNRRAYAYFLIPAEEALTPIAKRRLTALKEFSDLGAGFRLAALDLELRGAGNLLGAEQHGHLNSVGLDLYLKMLEQTVEELKGGASKPEVRTTLSLGLDIKIPEHYIADERQRLRMYKRVSSLSSSEQRADLESELLDRYGPIPESVSNLFNYALLKTTAERLLVQSIERKGDEVWLRFHSQAPVDPEKLKQFMRRHREANFRPDGVLRFQLPAHDGNLSGRVQGVLEELHAEA